MKNKSNSLMTQKIKKLLELKKYSANQMANAIGTNRQKVAYWIREGCLPATDFIPGIAEFFQIPIEYLFDETIPQTLEDVPSLSDNKKDVTLEKKATNVCTNDTTSVTKDVLSNIPKISVAGYDVPMEFQHKDSPYSAELINVFVSLEPKGQHLVLAEAHHQLSLQNNKKREKETSR